MHDPKQLKADRNTIGFIAGLVIGVLIGFFVFYFNRPEPVIVKEYFFKPGRYLVKDTIYIDSMTITDIELERQWIEAEGKRNN